MELRINGRICLFETPPMKPLSRVLREDAGLTGTKVGCYEGRCGSCTVIVDGRTVVSCLLPVGLVEGKDVRTVEGLADGDGRLSRLQDALVEAGGLQCGICTPGVLMTLTWALAGDDRLSEHDVRHVLAGNICRCTGYQKIVDAALNAQREHGSPPIAERQR
jgi:aerobic-type carbon monoxide dehydrogenase small subunit (CoxS/CutS family)